MLERQSADDTLDLSELLANRFNVERIHEDISKHLESQGIYERYNEAIREAVPEYDSEWKSEIVLPNIITHEGYTVFSVVSLSPKGETITKRLPLKTYLGIVAATNFKQRIRMALEHYHTARLNYAVARIPNRLEYDQVFFVKLDD